MDTLVQITDTWFVRQHRATGTRARGTCAASVMGVMDTMVHHQNTTIDEEKAFMLPPPLSIPLPPTLLNSNEYSNPCHVIRCANSLKGIRVTMYSRTTMHFAFRNDEPGFLFFSY